jgi:hypothetical protein
VEIIVSMMVKTPDNDMDELLVLDWTGRFSERGKVLVFIR